jgi:AraC-like DNA-binding protein
VGQLPDPAALYDRYKTISGGIATYRTLLEMATDLLEQEVSKAENPPPSLQEVGQRLGYQPTTLYKINRVACHAIAERFTAYRCQLREKRLQGYREEIRQIALMLQVEKVALTQRHIARYLTQPAILRDPEVRGLLRAVCRELETGGGEM